MLFLVAEMRSQSWRPGNFASIRLPIVRFCGHESNMENASSPPLKLDDFPYFPGSAQIFLGISQRAKRDVPTSRGYPGIIQVMDDHDLVLVFHRDLGCFGDPPLPPAQPARKPAFQDCCKMKEATNAITRGDAPHSAIAKLRRDMDFNIMNPLRRRRLKGEPR